MIQYLYLGRRDYGEALRLQEELVALRTEGRIGNVLLLLEHPPVLTLGRNAKRSNILASDEMLARRGVTLHEINRGGDVTYHGPGQLIGYPIFDLRSLRNASGNRLGPVDFVRLMEEALIGLCGEFSVAAGRICGLTGVWCGLSSGAADGSPKPAQPQNFSEGLPPAGPGGGVSDENRSCATDTSHDQAWPERKIAAIGIHVARGITSHGFAFNVTTNLDDFRLINPCGITDRPVTSLAREVPDPAALPTLAALAQRAARQFGRVFGEPVEMVESLAALRAQARTAAAAPESPATGPPDREPAALEFLAPEFPAEDTPLQVPPAIERLHQLPRPVKDRSILA
jgi:lipoyl(octanoyl) transferase